MRVTKDIYINALKKNLIYEIHPSCIEINPAHVFVDAAAGKTPERWIQKSNR